MNSSQGYESVASRYMATREPRAIGAQTVREWAAARLKAGETILDLGCGSGIPISQVLIDQDFNVYGVDASAKMVEAFRTRFPDCPIECACVQDSGFFDRQFDAVVAWGLIFLLDPTAQRQLIGKMVNALRPGGHLLFTAPTQTCTWRDVLTGGLSTSLGIEEYRNLLQSAACKLDDEGLVDEGDNHYYSAIKLPGE